MPVKEARTPAENRHGGAPRDAASRAWDARRLASAWARGVESAFTRAFDAERAKRVSLHPSASRRFAPVVREQKGVVITRAKEPPRERRVLCRRRSEGDAAGGGTKPK